MSPPKGKMSLYPSDILSLLRGTQQATASPSSTQLPRSASCPNPSLSSSGFLPKKNKNKNQSASKHARSEVQPSRVTTCPSGPMHFCVWTHQQMLAPERGTVGSGSASMNIHLERIKRHCTLDSSIWRTGSVIIMPLPSPREEWRVSRPRGTIALCKRCAKAESPWPVRPDPLPTRCPHRWIFLAALAPLRAKATAPAPHDPKPRARFELCRHRV